MERGERNRTELLLLRETSAEKQSTGKVVEVLRQKKKKKANA